MKRLFAALFSLVIFNCYSSENARGYYITNDGDTINASFEIPNLFKLHREVTVIELNGARTTFKPNEIKEFSFISNNTPDVFTPIEEIDNSKETLLKNVGLYYYRKTFNIEQEIHKDFFLSDSIWTFQSSSINENTDLFLLLKYGVDEKIQAKVYFTKDNLNKPYLISSIWLLFDNNKIIPKSNKSNSDWVSSIVNDYSTLNELVKNETIKAFPWDFKIVLDDYNQWKKIALEERPDTSLYLKGIIDAEKNYKPIVPFTVSCVGGTAFFLPGLASAVIINNSSKEKIKIPEKLELRKHKEYSDAYKHRAYRKRYKAASRGALTGGGIFIVGLIILAL